MMVSLRHPEETFDLVVIGSGAAGLTAALTAAHHGAKVVVLERGHLWGGTSATSGGTIWIPNNHLIAPAGGEDNPADAFRYIRQLAGDDASAERVQAFVDHGPRMVRFLADHSEVQFESLETYCDYHPELPGGRPGFRSIQALPVKCDVLGRDFETLQPPHLATTAFGRINWTAKEARPLITQAKGAKSIFLKIAAKYYLDIGQRMKTTRDRRITGGGALVTRLKASLNKLKVPVRLSTSLVDYVLENGRVVGVEVESGGYRQVVRATRGVVVASGGFERNAEMRSAHLPKPTSTDWTGGNPFNTGAPIAAAMRLGAKMHLLDAAWWAPGYKLADEDRARPMFVERSLPGSMMVDQSGRRFCNEAASYHVTGGIMAERAANGGTAPTWFVFDAKFRGKYALGPLFPGPPSFDRGVKPTMRALLKRADTLEELGKLLGMDAAVFAATVEKFNADARAGKDTEFARGESAYDRYYGDDAVQPNPCLAPLEQGPFYAVPILPCDIGTKGGMLTDVHARVLHEDGSVIEGLYAAGNCAASPMGRSYPAAGATLGPGMTFGWLAVRHALGVLE